MELVQSVGKGYDMIRLIISFLPLPFQAFLSLFFAVFCIGFLVSVLKWFLGGD